MQQATNSTGFDLIVSFEQRSEESCVQSKVRDILEIISVLGTWVSLTDSQSEINLDPPELSLMHQKRISFVGSVMCPLNLLKIRLYDGVIKEMIDNIITSLDNYQLKELFDFKKMTID